MFFCTTLYLRWSSVFLFEGGERVALLNDEKIDFEGTVLELLEKEGINTENIVVLVNGEILKRELWSERKIKKEDYIEVVSFVGGG